MVDHGGLTEAPRTLQLTDVGVTPEYQLPNGAPFRAAVMLVMMGTLECAHVYLPHDLRQE
jgi:hypothetical protein